MLCGKGSKKYDGSDQTKPARLFDTLGNLPGCLSPATQSWLLCQRIWILMYLHYTRTDITMWLTFASVHLIIQSFWQGRAKQCTSCIQRIDFCVLWQTTLSDAFSLGQAAMLMLPTFTTGAFYVMDRLYTAYIQYVTYFGRLFDALVLLQDKPHGVPHR